MPTLQATETMPLVTEEMKEIFEAFQDDTMVDSLILRQRLAEMLEALTNEVDTSQTVKMLKSPREVEIIASRVICALPRQLMISIVKHTLAYDVTIRPDEGDLRPHTYDSKYKGVYAGAIAIEGRGGAFLRPSEIRALCGRMTTYVDAAERYWKRESWLGHDDDRDFVKGVDAKFHLSFLPRGESPRWAKTGDPGSLTTLRAFINALGKYAAASATLGPGDQPIRQCPIMAGCTSRTIAEACRAYEGPSLGATTATWGLTMCSISCMGLVPRPILVPVVVTVESDELPCAEGLVMTFAQSLVTQQGFNTVEGGGQQDISGSAAIRAAKHHVYAETPWYREQASKAVDSISSRIETRAKAEKVSREILPALVELEKKYAESKRKRQELVEEINEMTTELLSSEFLTKRMRTS